MNRPVLASAVSLLVVCASALAFAASRLTHVGVGTVGLAAAIVTAGAAGVLMGQRWAKWFALFFFAVFGLVALGIGIIGGFEAASGEGGEWAIVRTLVVGGIAAAALVAGIAMVGTAVALGRALRAQPAGLPTLNHAGAIAAGVALTGVVVWIIGHQYLYRELWQQNDCLAGEGQACYRLANADGPLAGSAAADRTKHPKSRTTSTPPMQKLSLASTFPRFQPKERMEFARRGCALKHAASCHSLSGYLVLRQVVPDPDEKADFDLITAQCSARNQRACLGPAYVFLKAGRTREGLDLIWRTCELNAEHCAGGAGLLDRGRDASQRTALFEFGCNREDLESCRGLVNQPPAGYDPDRLAALRWKNCLVGDVNDCMPLIRRDPQMVCPEICADTSARRGQSCYHCSKVAREAGFHELAKKWAAQACASGYRADCPQPASSGGNLVPDQDQTR